MRKLVSERNKNETDEESKERRESMRMQMEERICHESKEQTQQKEKWENHGAMRNARNAQNHVRRVNNLLFTVANYQQRNCGR